jgi:hypothetical protein
MLSGPAFVFELDAAARPTAPIALEKESTAHDAWRESETKESRAPNVCL